MSLWSGHLDKWPTCESLQRGLSVTEELLRNLPSKGSQGIRHKPGHCQEQRSRGQEATKQDGLSQVARTLRIQSPYRNQD